MSILYKGVFEGTLKTFDLAASLLWLGRSSWVADAESVGSWARELSPSQARSSGICGHTAALVSVVSFHKWSTRVWVVLL